MTEYVLSNLASSAVGLVIGFLIGHAVRTRREEEPDMPHRLVENHNLLGLIIIALSVGTVAVGGIGVVGQNRIVECQTRYNAAATEAIRARAEANDEDRAALTALMQTIARAYDQTPETARANVREAIQTYVQQIEDGDAERAEHPLPEPPDPNTCQ